MKRLILISALLLFGSNGWAAPYYYGLNNNFNYFNESECDVKMLANDPDSECEIARGLIIKEMNYYRWLKFFRIRLVSRIDFTQVGDLVLKIKDSDGDTIVRTHIAFSLKSDEGIKTTFNPAYNCLSESISCVLSLENFYH